MYMASNENGSFQGSTKKMGQMELLDGVDMWVCGYEDEVQDRTWCMQCPRLAPTIPRFHHLFSSSVFTSSLLPLSSMDIVQ